MPAFLARQLRTHSGFIGLEAVGTAVIAASLGLGALTAAETQQSVGTTTLGQQLNATAQPFVLALLLLAGLSGTIMLTAALTLGGRARAHRRHVLTRLAGWSHRQATLPTMTERGLSQLAALTLILTLGYAITQRTTQDAAIWFLIAALGGQGILLFVSVARNYANSGD